MVVALKSELFGILKSFLEMAEINRNFGDGRKRTGNSLSINCAFPLSILLKRTYTRKDAPGFKAACMEERTISSASSSIAQFGGLRKNYYV